MLCRDLLQSAKTWLCMWPLKHGTWWYLTPGNLCRNCLLYAHISFTDLKAHLPRLVDDTWGKRDEVSREEIGEIVHLVFLLSLSVQLVWSLE